MGNKKQERGDRKMKRVFRGNRHTGSVETPGLKRKSTTESETLSSPSSSFSKLGPSQSKRSRLDFTEKECALDGNRIIDIGLLTDFINDLSCPLCHQNNLVVSSEKCFGLASKIFVKCYDKDCVFEKTLETSRKRGQGGKHYIINRQFVVAISAIGRHYWQAVRFAVNMDMPQPVGEKPWLRHRSRIAEITKASAVCSMREAASEAKEAAGSSNITASFDGTWQKRGFSSKNGVATAITVRGPSGASRVVDTEVMSNFCSTCSIMNSKLSGKDLEDWHKKHKPLCSKNHDGSAGQMESTGMMRIYRRSESARDVAYSGYLGDGDSKAFSAVSNAVPPIYKGTKIEKYECCGHVQKRMGRRLMDKVTDNKGKNFTGDDGKKYVGLGGSGRLTQKAILKIQGHYGAAIRNNVGDKPAMKRAIWSIFNHRNKDHKHCGEWCPSKTGNGDPNKNSLPKFVMDIIKPVFVQLSDDKLLDKCLHGGTQNTNESYHNLIWERCPKTTFVGRQRLELAVNDATIVYNIGESGRLPIFTQLGLNRGPNLVKGLELLDNKRLKKAYVPGQKAVIKARRARSEKSKSQKDCDSYGSGKF